VFQTKCSYLYKLTSTSNLFTNMQRELPGIVNWSFLCELLKHDICAWNAVLHNNRSPFSALWNFFAFLFFVSLVLFKTLTFR